MCCIEPLRRDEGNNNGETVCRETRLTKQSKNRKWKTTKWNSPRGRGGRPRTAAEGGAPEQRERAQGPGEAPADPGPASPLKGCAREPDQSGLRVGQAPLARGKAGAAPAAELPAGARRPDAGVRLKEPSILHLDDINWAESPSRGHPFTENRSRAAFPAMQWRENGTGARDCFPLDR